MTRKPLRASASDAVNPPIPAPATMIAREATARSGDLVYQHAFRRPRFAGLQVGRVAKKRRAIGTDDLVVIAEVEEDMRMVEGRIGAHAHELTRADLNDGNTGIVMEMRDDMIGHRIHLWNATIADEVNTAAAQSTGNMTILADAIDS